MRVLIAIGKVASMFGVTTETIRNWTRQGIFTEYRTLGGHRRYDMDEVNKILGIEQGKKKTVVYARVSSHEQKGDLERQAKEIEEYCEREKIEQVETIKDIGSGINYKKKGLKKLISEILRGQVERVIIGFSDRLVRFGLELLLQVCRQMNVKIVFLHEKEEKSFEEELVKDVLTIMTVYCSKIYGRRSHEKRRKGAAA